MLPPAVPLTRFVAVPPVEVPLVAVPTLVAVPPVTFPPWVLPLVALPPAELPPFAAPATCEFVTWPAVPPVAPCVTLLPWTVASPAVCVSSMDPPDALPPVPAPPVPAPPTPAPPVWPVAAVPPVVFPT